MASPLRDGSFDIAEIVLLTTPTSSIRLSPPELKRAGSRFSKAKPVASQLQVSAGSQPVLVPNGRINQRIDLSLNAPAKRIELRYHLSGITVRSMPSRPCADCHQSPGCWCLRGSPGCNDRQRKHRSQHRVPGTAAPRSSMLHRTAAESAREAKAAMEKCSDRRPVRPAEGAMRYGDSAALIVRLAFAVRRRATLADGQDK